jgi:hypothetical protein
MPNIRAIDMLALDDIFEMSGGYVLNFSDKTFAIFFAEELNIDINNPAYARNGTSKAKRLRYFLQSVDSITAARTLNALWEYREALRQRSEREETVKNAHGQLLAIINRITGNQSTANASNSNLHQAFDRHIYSELLSELQQLSNLEPQPRGYAFEAFLKKLFNRFQLEMRDPFRIRGEQIDGSFLLNSETYLLEAKWQNSLSGVDQLHVFQGKIQEKAAWSRGLFVSYTGFSPDGLHAFGRGKSVICMDGYDLSETLMREIPLNKVLESKVRRAAETGMAYVQVRELF